jgi:hypothetical protein
MITFSVMIPDEVCTLSVYIPFVRPEIFIGYIPPCILIPVFAREIPIISINSILRTWE